MPTAKANKEFNTFIRGIITEANPLSFPENASVDEVNFVLNKDGSRNRRNGMDYESLYTLVDTGFDSIVFDQTSISTYRWNNINNNPTLTFGVVFIFNKFWFLDLTTDSPSSNIKNSGSPLSFSIGTTNYSTNDKLEFADVNGELYISSKSLGIFRISYNSTLDSFSIEEIDIKVRDIFGVDDSLAITERPSILANPHYYNLKNQGWGDAYISTLFTDTGVYPSSADMWHLARDSSYNFDSNILYKLNLGNTPAPKGKYIISLFNRGESRYAESGINNLPADYSTGNVSCIASAFGRLFYSGITGENIEGDSKSPLLPTYVLFSSLVQKSDDVERCYQEADPTSEHISDIVDTDGGIIPIPEANNIMKLVAFSDKIIVFAENGVWAISGGETNFTASSHSVDKVSNVGLTAKHSVVISDTSVLYWTKAGIYSINKSDLGELVATNITEQTIQSLYNEIGTVNKTFSIGHYDPFTRKVSWLYNDDTIDYDGITLFNKYNKEIILDTILGSFYVYEIKEVTTDSPYVAAYMSTPSFGTENDVHQVVVNGVPAQVNGEDVIITNQVRTSSVAATKYLTIKPNTGGNYEFTLSWYNNTSWKDWYSDDSTGIDANGYIITGHDTLSDTMRYKSTPYILFHFKQTEDGFETISGELEATNQSSCYVSARWDFSDSTNSGKWSTPFQAYRLKRNYIPTGTGDTFDYGQFVVTTKNRVRGNGRALSLYIYTEEDKDCYIYGWAINYKGRTRV